MNGRDGVKIYIYVLNTEAGLEGQLAPSKGIAYMYMQLLKL